MFRPLLLIAATTLSLSSHAGFFGSRSKKELPNPNFNTVTCKVENDENFIVRIELSKITNLRGIRGEQRIPDNSLSVIQDGDVLFSIKELGMRRSGGSSADQLLANSQSEDGLEYLELILTAPEQVDIDRGTYELTDDLTGGINIQTKDFSIWLDDKDEPTFTDPLKCKVSLEER